MKNVRSLRPTRLTKNKRYLPCTSADCVILLAGTLNTRRSITGPNRYVPVLNPGYSSGLLILGMREGKKKLMHSCLNNA